MATPILDAAACDLDGCFERAAGEDAQLLLRTSLGARHAVSIATGTLLKDSFAHDDGAECLFIDLTAGSASRLSFVLRGAFRLTACAAGGWLLEPGDADGAAYWIPSGPVLRTYDAHCRILLDEPAPMDALDLSAHALQVTFRAPPGVRFNWVVWRIPASARSMCAELHVLTNVERAGTYLWSSQTTVALPSELYRHLIDGRIYQNARAWPRKWKFCCELDAYEIYLRMTGLERATGKRLYGLLRRQIVLSVMGRQSDDGGWYHGEWTDMNECHYRFHNGALLLLENVLDEWPDAALRDALTRGATFVAARTDETAIGTWFLHDSLEASAEALDEMHRQTGAIVKGHGAWMPTHMLGKSSTSKMILNTHVDTTVVLERYRRLTGDDRFVGIVDSAVGATRALLDLRPAEMLYSTLYRAMRLTMVSGSEGRRLPLPVRAFKRMVSNHVLPRLYLLKHRRPRIVMPGGFIDRHLGPMHFDAKYHAVNVMDLVRSWRQHPDERLATVIGDAIAFVMGSDRRVLRWWADAKPRQFAIVVLAEALCQLAVMRPQAVERRDLADLVLQIEDLGLGLPPSALGANAEATPTAAQVACPSAGDPRLRVVNLGTRGRRELLVVNPSTEAIPLSWETAVPDGMDWLMADGTACAGAAVVPPRGWLRGHQGVTAGPAPVRPPAAATTPPVGHAA